MVKQEIVEEKENQQGVIKRQLRNLDEQEVQMLERKI